MKKPTVRGDAQALERALADAASEPYVLMLFVSGTTPNSVQAITNTQRLCEQHLAGRHRLTIVDLYQQPDLAREHQIVAAPTLLRLQPLPGRRLVGKLHDFERLLLPRHGQYAGGGA